jgi:hypothetical protein
MSALNVTQDEADLLIASLNMYADVHKNASGVVPDDVAVLLTKLAPAPVVEVPVEDEAPETEDAAAKAAFMDGVPHEQYTHEDDKIGEDE